MEYYRLTYLDRCVIIGLLKGYTDKEIAADLQVSEMLIVRHRKRALDILTGIK